LGLRNEMAIEKILKKEQLKFEEWIWTGAMKIAG
jgi:hypothetical protein